MRRPAIRLDQTDEQLLCATSEDGRAFGLFYERRLNAVLAFFFRRTRDRELAADLAAETFASALIAVESYDPTQSPAMAWLFMLAQRRLVDALRRGRVEDEARRRLALDPIMLHDRDLERVEERAAAAERTPALAVLEELSAKDREAIEGRILNEESYPQLAERLQCSESVIRQRVYRGLSQLRRRPRDAYHG